MHRPISYNRSNNNNDSTKSIAGVKRKSVRFALTAEGHISTEAFEAKHPHDKSVWLNRAECKYVRTSAQSVVDWVKKGDTIWSEARRYSYIRTMSKVWRACTTGKNISEATKKELNFWASIGHSRRGLEKRCIAEVRLELIKRRKEHIEDIMFIQDRCCDLKNDFEQTARLLRFASKKLTKPTRKFAALLAAADASAVESELGDMLAQDIDNKLAIQSAERPAPLQPTSRAQGKSKRSVTPAA